MFFSANMLIISSMDMAPWPQLLLLKFKSGSNLPEGRAPLRQSWNDATTHPSLPYSLQKCQIAPCSSEQYTTAWPHYHIATTHSALPYNFPQLHCHIAKHTLLFLTYCQIATLHTTLLFRIKHEKPSVPAGSLAYSHFQLQLNWLQMILLRLPLNAMTRSQEPNRRLDQHFWQASWFWNVILPFLWPQNFSMAPKCATCKYSPNVSLNSLTLTK